MTYKDMQRKDLLVALDTWRAEAKLHVQRLSALEDVSARAREAGKPMALKRVAEMANERGFYTHAVREVRLIEEALS